MDETHFILFGHDIPPEEIARVIRSLGADDNRGARQDEILDDDHGDQTVDEIHHIRERDVGPGR